MGSTENKVAKVSSSKDGTEISIPSRKSQATLLLGVGQLIAWYFMFTDIVDVFSLLKGGFGEVDGIMIIWLMVWIVGGLLVLGLLIWRFFGKEVLKIRHDEMILNRNVFGIGTHQVFKKAVVKNTRFNKVEINYFSVQNRWSIWGIGEGKIMFNYKRKAYSFGQGVGDGEARYLVEKMKVEMGEV